MNKFVNNLYARTVVDGNSNFPCECTGNSFVGKDHNHIITGNLKIITDNKLHKFFSKCPAYREIRAADCEKAEEIKIAGIKFCIQYWHNKHGVTTSSFSEWKQSVILTPDEKSQPSFNQTNERKIVKTHWE